MKIGILFTGDSTWAGGLYYSLNIIKQLQHISETKKLNIVVFINKSTSKEHLEELKKPNIQLVNLDEKPVSYKVYCKAMGWITNSNYRFVKDINSQHLDVLFPLIHFEKGHENLNCRNIYWLYDFQHKFLPELFSKEEIIKRNANFQAIVDKAKTIVLSSNDSKGHLLKFYPSCKAKLNVYHFVSLIQKNNFHLTNKLPDNYLVVCNQFWPHKNHLVVLKAIEHLVRKKQNMFVVFTGKYDDVRNKDYVTNLQTYISENSLQSSVRFTGFIDREEQIKIIENAKAVIQPSLFEGWSTVIEDAKALNKFLIVSDIPIHREQISSHVSFFKPDDVEYLAESMIQVFNAEMKKSNIDYQTNCKQSIEDLLLLFEIN